MLHINLNNFEKITGLELNYFMEHILRGDNWGNFLKIASILESSSKRAVTIYQGGNPNSNKTSSLSFQKTLIYCREKGLISAEAYTFAEYIRKVRNDLVHKGITLNLDIEKIRGINFLKEYQNNISNFISIQGHEIGRSDKEHFNMLVMGLCVFIALISNKLYGDNWLKHI